MPAKKHTNRTTKQATRRQFLKGVASASAATLAAPWLAPASALGKDGHVAPSERVVMGCVGVGGRGTGNMKTFFRLKNVQIVALCDVEKGSSLYHNNRRAGLEPAREIVEAHYTEQAGGETFKGMKTFADFRDLMAIKDIDAVSVATPDHWHGLVSIAAARAGKDIYCEKPLTNSVAEGRAVVEAVQANGRVLQTGSHERSRDRSRYAAELVRNGRIGKLETVRIQMPCEDDHHKMVKAYKGFPKPQAVPESFDYDFWLGHTAKVPYSKERCHFFWRFILAYGGGEMTDRGAHIIDLAQMGMGADDTGPVEIEARGTGGEGLYNTFMDYEFTNTYANGVRMIGESKGPRGLRFEGTKGWIFVHVHGCRLEASDPAILKEKIGPDEIHIGRSPGHHQNFIECVKSRETPVASAEIGHRTASVCHLNNIAILTGRKLRWDPQAERFENDAEANALLSPKMRSPWIL